MFLCANCNGYYTERFKRRRGKFDCIIYHCSTCGALQINDHNPQEFSRYAVIEIVIPEETRDRRPIDNDLDIGKD